MKKQIVTILLAFCFSCGANSQALTKQQILEDYDYLVSFVEENYAPFDAIMQKGYKREYKALKKRLRKQLCNGEADLERVAADYVLWFYSQFDTHIYLGEEAFQRAVANLNNETMMKADSTLLTNPGNFEYEPKPVSCKVDSLTWLIRVPSCHPDFYDGTVNALQQFMESDCENLIIDIRSNDGGSDNVWKKYYDLLYDHPGKPEISWHRNTPKNLLYWKDVLKLQPSSPWNLQLIETCETSKKKFVKLGETDNNRQPTSRIKRAAVLIDLLTASSAESLVKFVKKHSDRCKVYGITGTNGCDLTGNCLLEPLPNSKLRVLYATSVDSGFYEKDFSSEGLGIAPDVIIPLPFPRKLTDNIDEWVLWVAEYMKR
ncbi:MAG: hypothetical protein J6W03_04205 [Bacteroidaceae bacterium]|nr:hypothetical protein [Bacteroidaceae bacterium]